MDNHVHSLLRGGAFKNLVRARMEDVEKKYNLKKMDVEIILYLSKQAECNTASDIQRCLRINKGYLSQTMDRLCRQGYVEAVADQEDRRYVHYILKESTWQIAEEAGQVWDRLNRQLFEGVSEEDLKTLRRISSQISQNMCKMLEK